MKLRMIAESSIHEPWDGDVADRMSREQSAKHLVRLALGKLRNILEPMGILKGGTAEKNRVKEPSGSKEAMMAFEDLRRTVQRKAKEDAQKIVAGEDTAEIEQYWGMQVPTGWHDVEAGQYGRPTTRGIYDDILRSGISLVQAEPHRIAQILQHMTREIGSRY